MKLYWKIFGVSTFSRIVCFLNLFKDIFSSCHGYRTIFWTCRNHSSVVHFTNLSKFLPSLHTVGTLGSSNWNLGKKDIMNRILLSKFKGTVLNPLWLKHMLLSVCHCGDIHCVLCRGAKDCMNKTSQDGAVRLQSC